MGSQEGDLIISINQNINDNPYDFKYLFTLLDQVENVHDKNIYFTFDKCGFLRPNAVAFLGAIVRFAQNNQNKIFFDMSSIVAKVQVNLQQNGFLSELGLGGGAWDGHSIPYREDKSLNVNDYAEYLSNRWLGRGWINISERLKEYITSPIIEAYINVFDHSHSSIGVITCGQFFPKQNELKLALVDFGVGIPYTVRHYLQNVNMTASETLRWAFEPGKTTKDQRIFARGNGLKILKDFIEINNGRLEIYSDTGYACIARQDNQFRDYPKGFKGTIVQITLMCDEGDYTLPGEDDYNSDEFFI